MKKFIALLLAMLMVFATATVCVFAEETTEEPTTAAESTEEFNFEDLPLWTIPILLKLAKVVVKIMSVFAKLGIKTGLIDMNDIIGSLTGLVSGNEEAATTTTTVAPVVEPSVA